jgi:S1-C subfamily serine protease
MTTNKILSGVLVLLVLCIGATGYFVFTLNRQVDRLDERLASFEGNQAARFQAITDNVSALQASTASGLSALQSQVAGTLADVSALKTDVASTGDKIGAVSSQVTALDKRVAGAEANLAVIAGTVIDTSGIYQKAVRATVRITDGTATAGSGFVSDNNSHVITAYHVVSSLASIYIMMYDGRVSHATLQGYCPFSDVAVLKLDNNPSIVPLALGDSGKIKVGQPVVAIGSPNFSDESLGLRDTLTSGIVSQLNRYVDTNVGTFANIIQFDTAINFGNSGGPVIGADGKVIGIVDARVDPKLGDGISWAVSSNKIKRVVDALISKGSFPYPWMGLGISDLTPQQVTQKGLDSSNGAYVGTVVSGGPSAAAGVQVGDVITAIDGVTARNIEDLLCYLGEFKSPGDTAVLELTRDATKLKVSITVGTRPAP